jgi:glutathione peroxidase
MPDFYDFSARRIDGTEQPMADYRDKVVLVVNVASFCGFTPQYTGLETLYKTYGDKGLVVLGFPCNQFGEQEPGAAAEIASFCELNYNVTFPLYEKVAVNGPDAAPLFQWLKKAAPGMLGLNDIKWNFTKFLIGKDGHAIKRFASTTDPSEIAPEIEALLS